MRDLENANLEDMVLVFSEVVSEFLRPSIIVFLSWVPTVFLLLTLSFVHERLHFCHWVERILEGSIQAESSVSRVQTRNYNQGFQLVGLHSLDQPC